MVSWPPHSLQAAAQEDHRKKDELRLAVVFRRSAPAEAGSSVFTGRDSTAFLGGCSPVESSPPVLAGQCKLLSVTWMKARNA